MKIKKKENKTKDAERKNRRITKGKGRRWLRCEIKDEEKKNAGRNKKMKKRKIKEEVIR